MATVITDNNIRDLVRTYIENRANLPADLQNVPIGQWNVNNVTNMDNLFRGYRDFNEPLDQWRNKLKNVTTMKNMFNNCRAFSQDLHTWILGHEDEDMDEDMDDDEDMDEDEENIILHHVDDRGMFENCRIQYAAGLLPLNPNTERDWIVFNNIQAYNEEYGDPEEPINQAESEECSICTEKFMNTQNQAIFVTPCNHFFHNDCLLNNCISGVPQNRCKCPNCRSYIGNSCGSVNAFRNRQLDNRFFENEEVHEIYFNQPNPNQQHQGGKKRRRKMKLLKSINKRKTNKRKTNKRKTNRRKTNRRKNNRRKTNKRKTTRRYKK